MPITRPRSTSISGRFVIASTLAGLAALSLAGCPTDVAGIVDGPPKDVQLRFRTFDIGTDDCEDIFSFGDFTVQLDVYVMPAGDEVFTTSRFAELGSASFQATVQSIDLNETASFTLNPDEEFEIRVTITEDDPIDSGEPQPWTAVRTYNYLVGDSVASSFVNGPGCFRDDRLDYEISVTTQ